MEANIAALAASARRPDGLVGLGSQLEAVASYLALLVGEGRCGWDGPGAREARDRQASLRPALLAKKNASGAVRLLVVHGPPGCGKRTLAEAAAAAAGFVAHRHGHGQAAAEQTLNFCKSAVSGVDDMIRGGGGVTGKAVLVCDAQAHGAGSCVPALLAAVRAALASRPHAWPVVVVATSRSPPSKSSEIYRAADAVVALAHPSAAQCYERLAGEPFLPDPLDPAALADACARAEGGGLVASLTAYYAPAPPSGADSACPPMFSGFFERVHWALRRANDPPGPDTYPQIQAAVSNEPCLAALALRETYRPGRTPAPVTALDAARGRLDYYRASDGVEAFGGSDAFSSEYASAAFQAMAMMTSPDAAVRFPGSYSMASARKARARTLPDLVAGRAPSTSCHAAEVAFIGQPLDGALTGKRRAPAGKRPAPAGKRPAPAGELCNPTPAGGS